MRTDDILKIPPIKAELIPPRCHKTGELANPTGEIFRGADGTGHDIVYKMFFLDVEKTRENKVQRTDPQTGKPMFRKGDQGPYPIYKAVAVFEEREFLLMRTPSGGIDLHLNFRPSAEEIAQDNERRLVAAFEKGLAVQAVRRGLTADQLVAKIMGELPEEDGAPAGPPAQGPDEHGVEVVDFGNGWYNVKVDGALMSEKNLRRKDAEELARGFRAGEPVAVGAGVDDEPDEGQY